LFPGTGISSTQSIYIPEKKNHNLKVVSLRRPENLAKQTCILLTEFRKTNINAVASKKQKQTIDAYLTNVEKSASRRQRLAGHGRRPDGDPQAQRDRHRDRARSLMSSSSLRAAARKAISASGIAFAFFLPCLESASPLLQQAWGLREMKSVVPLNGQDLAESPNKIERRKKFSQRVVRTHSFASFRLSVRPSVLHARQPKRSGWSFFSFFFFFPLHFCVIENLAKSAKLGGNYSSRKS
jgi:hypothetical protein